MHHTDVLIIGSGLAALTTALHLAATRHVTILTKRELLDGSSAWAQGGIAAVLANHDSLESHVRDTLIAGAGLCSEPVTRFVVSQARDLIDWLVGEGVPFTRDAASASGFHLTREGGHSERRVVHAQDATGRAVQTTLAERIRRHPNIRLLENYLAIDLVTGRHTGGDEREVLGVYALNNQSGHVETFAAGCTVLATGGAGKVYLYTTNPDTATGDGIAMAWRAGCRVGNMEFIQFHPTCLYQPQAKSFLITEAVRGEGGILRLPDGRRFMPDHDPRAELAPRDIVARAIDYEMKKRGVDCVYLDISHKPAKFIIEHFPNIFRQLSEWGIDMTQEPIPVVPAAHYTCGGVVTDMAGCTDLRRLYAVGEVAFTGLHGANRLASNSLLECMVFGRAAAGHILPATPVPPQSLPEWDESRVTDADEEIVIAHNWAELRRFMWDYVGIVRTNKRLARAAHRIKLLQDEIDEFYRNFRVSHDLIELRNLVMTADLIVRSAMLRHESRGLHYSRDYPEPAPQTGNTVLDPRLDFMRTGAGKALMPEI
jgi:L-aspartate oxidase